MFSVVMTCYNDYTPRSKDDVICALAGKNHSKSVYFIRILYPHQLNFHEAGVFKLWFTFNLVFCQRKGGITKPHLPRLEAPCSRLYKTYKTTFINVLFALFDERQRDVRSRRWSAVELTI
jgi:hypothetical protein